MLNLISATLRLVSVLHIGSYGFPLGIDHFLPWTIATIDIACKYLPCICSSYYSSALLGQILGGLSQPLFTNCPARVASQWFETDLANTVTTIASMSNPIGIALGQIMPLMFPTQAFEQLMITQVIRKRTCFILVRLEVIVVLLRRCI